MNTFLQLSVIAVFPVVISAILYFLDKKTAFGNIKPKIKQLIYGLIFGGLAVLGTEFGVDLDGAVANARDASVLTAGLVFGAPAGIIAGLIGGIERWFAVLWGAGTYTRLACTISTILAGFIGAALRKWMFDDKKPSWSYALCIGLVTEVFHMLMIFITNMGDIQTAFDFVEKCSLPMITVNGFSVMLSVLVIALIGKERRRADRDRKKTHQISTQFQRGLMICIVCAILITGSFTLFLQNSICQNDTDNLLSLNLRDVKADISDASDENLLKLTRSIAAEINSGVSLSGLAEKYDVTEINIVDENGIIAESNIADFVGYDMNSGLQSSEFLVLLSSDGEYVQKYQAISYDQDIFRKYAGVSLDGGGFVQVGYGAERFQKDIAGTVYGVTRNRHVGKSGRIIIVDMNMEIVSDRGGYEGQIFDLTGMPPSVKESARFNASVYGKKSYCMYAINEGYYIIAALPVGEATFSRNISVYVMMFMEIIIFVSLFVLIYFMIKKLVVDNIRKINKSLAKITGGNLDVTVNVRTNEEFASLSDDINSTVVTMKKYIAEAEARIDKELEFAKSIQHSALPSVFPPYPNRNDFDIYAVMDAAKEVGGDFYDFYLTAPSELVFLIADVSGKGIPAAMFMMRAKTLIKSFAEAGMSVEEVLAKANAKLCEGNDAEMFVTAWIGKLNLTTGALSFANAGHNPPLIKRKNSSYEYLPSSAGFVLAGMEGIKYRKNELTLYQGDTLFLYTDGVTEATNAKTELYGAGRLKAFLNGTAYGDTAQSICSAVQADLNDFVAEAPQFDDITMLCLKFRGGNIK